MLLQGKSNLPISESEAEIGYWLGEDFWGKGYVTEATLRVLQYAFEELNLTQLWAGAYEENIASQRVLEKCGFRYHHTLEDFLFPLIGEGIQVDIYIKQRKLKMNTQEIDAQSLQNAYRLLRVGL